MSEDQTQGSRSASEDPPVWTPVLATKLFPPAGRRLLVARPRLLEQLDSALDASHRLTVVAAPAGFGKTTLMSDWSSDAAGRGPAVKVGWVSLDEGDNDLARLVTHVVAALGALDVASHVVELLRTASTTDVMTALVNDVTSAGRQAPGVQWVLVLDDYHVIESPEVHQAVTFLLDHCPEPLHLMIATRADPPLPLARLRTRGQLTEVRAADLRFTAAEASELLTTVMGVELGPAEVDALEQRTEGWVAGLQLAALSLRDKEPAEVTGFVDAFTGSNRFVIDFLVDEVLSRQPAEVRSFLLATAVLRRFTGSLCDAVTGRGDGALVLEALERDNLLVPLDSDRQWYRYHHLFADVLHARLIAERPEQVSGLHRRAGDWHAARGLVEDAVRHCLAAEDFVRAGQLMEEALPDVRRARQDRLLLSWVAALPAPAVRRSPVLSILSGWAMMMSGDLDEAEARFDDAEAALAAGARDLDLAATWADTDDLRAAPATISVYRASLAQARGDVEGTGRHAQRALDLAAPEEHFVRGAAEGFLGLAAWAAGDVRSARSTFSAALRSLHAAGNLVDELDATVVLADMSVAAGRPAAARQLYEQALRSGTARGEPYPRAVADLHVGLAELDRELDELATAQAHLETARVLGERASITENRHRWFVVMAQVRAALGEHAEVAPLLDQAAALYRRGFYPDVRPIAATRARIDVAAGDLASASGWARASGLGTEDDPDYLREYEHLTLARLLLAQHRVARQGHEAAASAVEPVLGLLARRHDAAVAAGREGSLLEIRVLQALAHHARDDTPRAVATLVQALAEAPEPQGHVRLYLDEGAPMLELLREVARTDGVDPEVQRQVGRLLGRGTVAAPRSAAALPDPLSPRELQVLRLLDSELTGPQIAGELYIALNTLRTHTKRIFTKLDVSTRAAAVRRARELGLL